MKKRITSDFTFDVWINAQADFLNEELGSFDDNWIVSAGDLFGEMELPGDDSTSFHDQAA